MSVGIGAIKCLIENDTPFSRLYDFGVDESFFEGEHEKKTIRYIKEFRKKYNKYPTLKTVALECNLKYIDSIPTEPIEYWVEKLKERKQHLIINDLFKNLNTTLAEGKLKKAHQLIELTSYKLKNIESLYRIKNLYEISQEAIIEHESVQTSGQDVPGIPFGLKSLDKLTGGMCGGDFIFLVGETGVNKSYISLYFGLQAYLKGKNIMFISPEMVERQIGRRALALTTHTQDSYLKKGLLSYYGLEKIKEKIKEFESKDNWFKILPSGMFTDIHKILSVVHEYQPDLLIVDGIYLLKNHRIRTNSPWKEDESIIFLLRELSLQQNIPVLCTTQYTRSKKNKREGARGTQSVEQTATLFLSLEFEFEEDKEMAKPVTTRLLKIKKGRDGERMVLRLLLDFRKTAIEEDEVISGPGYLMEVESNTIVEDL